MKRIATAILLAGASVAVSGCLSGPGVPDEFRVVRKAPLTMPPDFNLRPPEPGSSRPAELNPDAQARVAVFGADLGSDASEAEKLFVKAAGGDATERSVRAQVDFDSAQSVRKSRNFADSILNFGRSSAVTDPVVDASAEAARIASEEESLADVTGGKPVVIRRKGASKLPGL